VGLFEKALLFVFSSMTSLQKEEFFELVATAQARRLDDQRAQLEKSQPPKPKPAVPVPVPKEDLYNMILTTQAQGRLEDQRSRAPGPMDDEDFFSLLLRVQGGRMDEQRTELPGMLQT
uniref:G-protein signaling modulator 3 n=1 Tax=Cyclopterus lumpus TaxID=8103 RepID=A0A8C3ADM7_CYCLU